MLVFLIDLFPHGDFPVRGDDSGNSRGDGGGIRASLLLLFAMVGDINAFHPIVDSVDGGPTGGGIPDLFDGTYTVVFRQLDDILPTPLVVDNRSNSGMP